MFVGRREREGERGREAGAEGNQQFGGCQHLGSSCLNSILPIFHSAP